MHRQIARGRGIGFVDIHSHILYGMDDGAKSREQSRQMLEMAARNEPGGQASGACEALAARIDAIMRTGVQFSAQVTPPRCTANAQAEASCSGACNVEVTPAEIVARCEPRSPPG